MNKYNELLKTLDEAKHGDDLLWYISEAAAAIRELQARKTMYDDVANFHAKFNILVAGNVVCRMPAYDIIEYRTKFLEEELTEFKTACEAGSLVDAFDALLDIAWVAMGTAHYFGAPWEEGWVEVVRANMDRVLVTRENCPPEKRYRRDMVMKPPGWKAPDLLRVIKNHNTAIKRGTKPLDIPEFLRKNVDEPSQETQGTVKLKHPSDRGVILGLEEITVSEKELSDVSDLGPEFHSFACTCEICIPTTDEATGD